MACETLCVPVGCRPSVPEVPGRFSFHVHTEELRAQEVFVRSAFYTRQVSRPQLPPLLTELGLKQTSLHPLVPIACRMGWLLHRSSHHHVVWLAVHTKALPTAHFVHWLLVAQVVEGHRLCRESFGLIWQWQRTHGVFCSCHSTQMRASAKCFVLPSAGIGRVQHLLSTLKLWCCIYLVYCCCLGLWLYLSFNYFDAVWVLFWLECIKARTARARLLLEAFCDALILVSERLLALALWQQGWNDILCSALTFLWLENLTNNINYTALFL